MAELSTPVPPGDLVFLVSGHRDRENFALPRRPAAETLAQLLGKAGCDLLEFGSILDFGCGCGRILAGLEGMLRPGVALHGCDINRELVAFCRAHISFATIADSGFMPPLPYQDQHFDLVYACSVFTHMTLPAMMQWAGEFARILKPGGVAVVTTHGSFYHRALIDLDAAGFRALHERGYHVHLHCGPDETWRGSNEYAAFVTTEFLIRLFAGFNLLASFPGMLYGPTHFQTNQDVTIFRRV